MDCIDAANAWSEAARRPVFLRRNVNKSTRDMGSIISRQESSQNPRRPASQEIPRAPKRQRIEIDGLDLARKLEESKISQKDLSAPELPEEPTSLEITLSGILDKYGEQHESLIPRRLDGVPVKARCSVQIYHPTNECRDGTLTDIHEELLRVSQEGVIRTTWNPATGHPETEINLPRSFVVPIRELYVPKASRVKSRRVSVGSLSEISDSEDDSDELLDEGEYGLAEKYFCHVSFSTVRSRPWPPLGLDIEISRTSSIGKQLRHGHSNKRDLKLVSKTELLPLQSLSMKVPLEIKLGPDRQTTQYQLALDAKWEVPEIARLEAGNLETTLKMNCVWRIKLGDQEPTESRLSDYSCGICLARSHSIKALCIHLSANHSQFEFTLAPSSDGQDFILTLSDRAPKNLPKPDAQTCSSLSANTATLVNNAAPVELETQVNSAAPAVEVMRSIFDFEDDVSSPPTTATNSLPTPEPPSVQDRSNLGQSPARNSLSTSASASEPQSMASSLNTTPDAGSESESDEPRGPRKLSRPLKSRRAIIEEDEDFSSSQEDTTPKFTVPKTPKPFYDFGTTRLLKPGDPLIPSTVSYDWWTRKHADIINSIDDMTPEEREFINRWDPFVLAQKSTSKTFVPAILEEFINVNRQWLDEKQCRKKELLKHLENLTLSGRIEKKCMLGCLEMFQNKRVSSEEARQTRKTSSIAREERSLLELWDSNARNSTTNSLEKLLRASETLRTDRSVHAPDGESVAMLRLFLSYHGRTSRLDLMARDSIFYDSRLPLPPAAAESEYVRFFKGFDKNFKSLNETKSLEQLMFSFLADNTAWFYEDIERFQWVRKHLQELHWTKNITLKTREKLLAYLETMESAYDTDEDVPDVAASDDLSPGSQTASRNIEKEKETAAPPTPTTTPFLIKPDPLNPPRPRNIRAQGECECGGYARPGESVRCAAEGCIARTFHRACVPNAPPRGSVWYCRDCATTGLGEATGNLLDRMDLSK
ncbi:hypothetical protein V494_00755 [Pseudogymnoascus sp. VKM F-4513 (FW-928)]|nr:hypothetical protein V494_00755 [Pseudogymnoascus sp. VKM F-4513 (FW-928)]